jgi:hypothetical protein
VISDATFVNCSTYGDGNADYGALSDNSAGIAESILLDLSNLNFSGCYTRWAGSSIYRWGGSDGCGTYRFISVNGARSVTSIELFDSGLTTIDSSNFVDNADSISTIYCGAGLISLRNSYFRNNKIDLSCDSLSGAILANSCFFSSALPSVSWLTEVGNEVNYRGLIPVICHLDTHECPASSLCPTDAFAPSGIIVASMHARDSHPFSHSGPIGQANLEALPAPQQRVTLSPLLAFCLHPGQSFVCFCYRALRFFRFLTPTSRALAARIFSEWHRPDFCHHRWHFYSHSSSRPLCLGALPPSFGRASRPRPSLDRRCRFLWEPRSVCPDRAH